MDLNYVLIVSATASISVIATYAIMRSRLHTAEKSEVRATAWRESQDQFLRDLHAQTEFTLKSVGKLMWKRRYLVISERLFYRDLPLSGWFEHEQLLEEEVDEKAMERLKQIAEAASIFATGLNPGKAGKILGKAAKAVGK